ncbi:MAG TPA: discoidin domain-containing protein, partial [Turneriella sp.]|nr:discoidin domain-containing protein [Turneriella sp.]
MVALHIERSVPHVTVLLDFEKQIFTNSITYECSAFVLIDILWSNDGKSFYRTHGITHENRGDIKKFSFPLIGARYFQVHLYQEGGLLHKNEVRRFEIGFLSQAKVRASTELDRLWVADNLTDRREDYGWASKVHEKDEGDTIDVDLGALFFVKEIQLKSIADEFNFFPVAFQLQLSEDNAVWHTLASEDRFYAGPTTWHAWWFAPTRARYARVQINKHAHYKKGEYQSKILDIAVLAEPEAYSAIGKERDNFTRMASENIAGLVLLSPNNISAPNRVVQSNDSRLRNATTEYRGIMQFARDNEAAQEKAVQGNDSRLRTATEVNPGIVQLAKSGEDRELTAVQGSDVRLKQATQDSVGIVQLAKDGEAKPGVVVQGNDVRLKSASHNSFGLVQLAKDGETTQGKVIQASDFRLRTASQSWPGIIQIAAHSEIASNKAVAADDPRLQEGDESHKGGVQFARKGEIADLKAVQASDPRLHTATEENIGVVQFARSGT